MIEFVAKYAVSGTTFFDNNGGANHKQPQVFDEFDALLGRVPEVVHGTSLKNLAFAKQVGMVFTTNNWATSGVASGIFSHMLKSGDGVWTVLAPVGTPKRVDFAILTGSCPSPPIIRLARSPEEMLIPATALRTRGRSVAHAANVRMSGGGMPSAPPVG